MAADVHYLWSEVDRLKAQVAQLQVVEKRVVEDQSHIREYVASFVTHAQLDAALCTKVRQIFSILMLDSEWRKSKRCGSSMCWQISQSNVTASVDKLRVELMGCLAAKAGTEMIQNLQAKKLDISVYESAAWDLKKFRAALEQSMHDLFASFAHQIEAQVDSKVSIEDFNHIFNLDANGQKEAIESAASRITRMNDHLESLQEYVNADRLRQHKVADLNVSVLDLTRKQNASRDALAQLESSVDASNQHIAALETSGDQIASRVAAIADDLQRFKAQTQSEREKQGEKETALVQDVQELQTQSQKMIQELEQIQHFTRDTLLKTVDAKVKQLSNEFHHELDDLNRCQRQYAQLVNGQMSKASERLQYQMEQVSLLDSRMRKLGAHLRTVSDDLSAVKGPLATLATNLREENAAILEELQRSQNESRDIMLDYQELLEKEQQLPSSTVPSRPSSSASARAASAYASRKHKQQVLTMGKNVTRPHTSKPVARTANPLEATQLLRDNNTSNSAGTTLRAQTAGSTRNRSKLPSQAAGRDNNLGGIMDASGAPPLDAIRESRKKNLYMHFKDEQHEEGEALFHFPLQTPRKDRDPKSRGRPEAVASASEQVPQTQDMDS